MLKLINSGTNGKINIFTKLNFNDVSNLKFE